MESPVDAEKNQGIRQIEQINSSGSSESYDARIEALTPMQRKKVIRRIDRRLVLTLGCMYCVSLMDRTNLGIAAVAGMAVDLRLIGERYNIITLVFFISYVLLQPPATVVLRKLGPRAFLPSITVLWGVTMLVFGFVKSWTDMIPLRILLGVFEAGFFPSCAFLLSTWYPRYELQKRNAVFYLIGSLASAFSGILAYGFWHMNALGDLGPAYGQHYGPTEKDPTAPSGIMPGIAGWRWIFIMQGLITIVVGLIGALTIADFPEKAAEKGRSCAIPFLKPEEADFVVARIEKDRHDAIATDFSVKHYLHCACDAKVWGFAWLFGLTTTVTYAIAYFLPIILNEGMGFSVAASQCLISPPYVLAAIWMFTCAWLGDKYHIRGPFIIFNALLGIFGLPLLGFAHSNAVRYFGVFLAVTSANANVPCILTYQANNIRGQWKRALASATLVGAGGIGGIVGTLVFRSQDKPGYKPGIYATLTASSLIIAITLLLEFKFWRANTRAASGGKIIEGLEGFRYTL